MPKKLKGLEPKNASQLQQLYQTIADNIVKTGRQVIAVMPERRGQVGFCYTIGNQEKLLPELLIFGPVKDDAGWLLNTLSEMMIDRNGKFKDGEIVDLGGKSPIQVWDTTVIAKVQYTVQAGEFYNDQDYEVQQVVLPDPNGRFPTDEICHKAYKVPVLRKLEHIMNDKRQK